MAKKKVVKKTKKKSTRKCPLKKVERDNIHRLLVAHYGLTKVEKYFVGVTLAKDQEPILLRLRSQMEREIEMAEKDAEQYFAIIDNEYKKVGRPKGAFTWKEFEYLCSIGCTLEEISGFFQMTKDGIQTRVKEEFGETFSERYEKFSQGVKISLRRKQIGVALDGDTPMLKFLGKNMLGQKDKLDFDGEVKVNSWVDLMNNLDPEKVNGTEPE